MIEEAVLVQAIAAELGTLHELLDHFWERVDGVLPNPPDIQWRSELASALAELAANIILHAYPRNVRGAGQMELRLRLYPSSVEARLIDQGKRYQPRPPAPSPRDNLFTLPEGGFGMAIIRAVVDRLAYHRTPAGTNCWKLIKRF